MPTFDTPQPISVTVSLAMGDVLVSAGDRTDTVVDVRPTNPSSKFDVKMTEQTRVEFADGRLLVKTPRPLSSLFGRPGSVDVDIKLPSGSDLDAYTAMGDLRCTGHLGECRVKSGYGEIRVEQARSLHANSGGGEVTVDHVEGDANVYTGTGMLRIGQIGGNALVKNATGDTWVGEATGDLRISNSHGDINVDRANAAVTVKTAHGNVRIGQVSRGSVVMQTAHGDLEVGIRRGTAAWLDLKTSSGKVRSHLDISEGPEETDETVELRGHTYHGDITVKRSS